MAWSLYAGPLLEGAWVTVQLTAWSTLLGTLVSFALGIGQVSACRVTRGISRAVVDVVRGTPLLVHLFWLYFALPLAGQALGLDWRLPPVVAGVLALGLNIGAYGAEVVRGALLAVPRSQREAALALDFTPRQTLWRIALPQALPEMMPSFGNLVIQNLKDTALVSLISLGDLALRAEQLRNLTQDSTTIYSALLLMYFGMALVLAGLMRLLEHRAGRWRRKGH